ncbi:cryptochrome/deoxyribodipyrimidine photo-lyase family protein [Cognatitamlana onchidii]|uniref:cryptochrome/deoxyribodipyrimidine photo-lyase family protein n=1 Tax=Cognatitamlana onchidii TaxID=2562860 RepID=UPI0010A6846A|nr:deoxyribodipyrimidine photo-lyase [Algibacter onchidii]
MSTKPQINIVWLKRDLRLHDNGAINNALKSSHPSLLLYCFEPMLLNDKHYSKRHWDFIKQSLIDLNKALDYYNSKILVVQSDIIPAINMLLESYKISHVFSHQETGLLVTYNRDKSFQRFCKNNFITWKENINNGIQRGLKNRDDWNAFIYTYYAQGQYTFAPMPNQLLHISDIEHLEKHFKIPSLSTNSDLPFQKGGRTVGLKYLKSFLEGRYHNYMSHISKPQDSRTGCSRISPYIAWGNVSVREVYQEAQNVKELSVYKKPLEAFLSRLRWQAHFIQKFEMEHTMEEASINRGFHKLKKSVSKAYQTAWKTGKTGYPLIDACMRCLNETGYLNFRMRALVVSFFTHNLWQPWQEATSHLSQMFLDFEPGIHFPQLQMQAGETGVNMLRIYNPIKNSLEHDPEAKFIKKWVPELRHLDTPFAHQPSIMTPLEQEFNNFKLGIDYPNPIVDLKSSRKIASTALWELRKSPLVIEESKRILNKHTPRRRFNHAETPNNEAS